MDNEYLDAGKIINTHGIRGEVKIEPWADSPEFLLGFDSLYIDKKPVKVKKARVHQQRFVIAELEGITNMNEAELLKNKIVQILRSDVELDDGQFFIADVIGMPAETEDGEALGKVSEILNLPGGDVFVINGKREILVPVRPEFLIRVDNERGAVIFRLIEGM